MDSRLSTKTLLASRYGECRRPSGSQEILSKCSVSTCGSGEAVVSDRASTMPNSQIARGAHSMEHEVIPNNTFDGTNGTHISGLD